jgi:hypothetical protein
MVLHSEGNYIIIVTFFVLLNKRGDKDLRYMNCVSHYGDLALLYQIQDRIKPNIHCFGHFHSGIFNNNFVLGKYVFFCYCIGYGYSYDGNTVFINSSICNDRMPVVYSIVFFVCSIFTWISRGYFCSQSCNCI